jgi:hypothetical protein
MRNVALSLNKLLSDEIEFLVFGRLWCLVSLLSSIFHLPSSLWLSNSALESEEKRKKEKDTRTHLEPKPQPQLDTQLQLAF